MRALCFTVDVDRDVNIRIPGGTAGSVDRGSGTAPRFASSERGLSLLLELLDEIGMKATFFAEAATLRKIDIGSISKHDLGIHGAEHEDLTLIKEAEKKRAILKEAVEAVKDIAGVRPNCFRAPYMKADKETIEMLPEFGIDIDSSLYTEMSASLMPKKMKCGVWEFPVPEGKDAEGKKIAAFLWPMHEQKRKPEDYIELASQMEEGVFVLATHTWHMVESRERGIMSDDEIKKNVGNVRKVLEGIADAGIPPASISGVRSATERSLL